VETIPPPPASSSRRPKRPLRWRKVLHALHRDLGFFAVGLTVVYAVSGIAVNHREHWNYNYAMSEETRPVGVPSALLGVAPAGAEEGKLARDREDALVAKLTAILGRPAPPRKAFWRGPDRLALFYGTTDEEIVDYRPSLGAVELLAKADRFLIRDMNVLHLNEARGAWTWIADGFALILIFLAVSGALIVRGRKGLVGRGGVLMMLGIALPVIALLLIR